MTRHNRPRKKAAKPRPKISRKQWLDTVHSIFPGIPDSKADYLLWNNTSFPFFGTDDPLAEVTKSLTVLKETLDKGCDPCDHCNKPAEPGEWECAECAKALRTGFDTAPKEETDGPSS